MLILLHCLHPPFFYSVTHVSLDRELLLSSDGGVLVALKNEGFVTILENIIVTNSGPLLLVSSSPLFRKELI